MSLDSSLVSRRGFTHQALGSLLTFSLLDTLFSQDLFADEIKPLTSRWLADVNQLANDVKDRKVKQLEWQKKIEELYAQVNLPDLLKMIDFQRISAKVDFPEHGARSLRFDFQQVEGVPTKLAFGRQIFALKKDRSVVPHGHINMTTAFLILQGDLRGRHYDRLKDEGEHLIIKPTIDRKFTVGECSTISDYKDNIHWFQAQSDTAFIFNIHVMDVNPGAPAATGRVYLDPNGEKLSDGLIRAKRVDYATVNKLYG
jgi:hypothetical protein